MFYDLQKKAEVGEISTRSVDLRGLLDAIGLIEMGIKPRRALKSGLVNKAFDEYERKIVEDTLNTTASSTWKAEDIFDKELFVVDFSGVK